jgi:hypothetical protein
MSVTILNRKKEHRPQQGCGEVTNEWKGQFHVEDKDQLRQGVGEVEALPIHSCMHSSFPSTNLHCSFLCSSHSSSFKDTWTHLIHNEQGQIFSKLLKWAS